MRIGDYVKRRSRTGRLLTRGRIAAGLSQERVGEALGVSRAQVSNVEAGKSSIQAHAVLAWAKVCKVDPLALLRALARDHEEAP